MLSLLASHLHFVYCIISRLRISIKQRKLSSFSLKSEEKNLPSCRVDKNTVRCLLTFVVLTETDESTHFVLITFFNSCFILIIITLHCNVLFPLVLRRQKISSLHSISFFCPLLVILQCDLLPPAFSPLNYNMLQTCFIPYVTTLSDTLSLCN